MRILVTDEFNDKIFKGDADEFLELNDYDEELEIELNNLNRMDVGDSVDFVTFLNQSYNITKIVNNNYYE